MGSSGCGKTTLSRLILGRLKLESGSINIFDRQIDSKHSFIPGSYVGFMPQEIALFKEFTIKENLEYYGLIHKMNIFDIREGIENLVTVLNIPKNEILVSKLSGGQQRLVSLAVAMIHKPPLLILDEPTVGVDSLLRFQIWRYLNDICTKEGNCFHIKNCCTFR